ncbi:MAG: glycosyltransferase [Polyangiaceae bacterium]
MGERHLEEVDVELGRAIGRPRTVLDAGSGREHGGKVARNKGADVVRIENDASAGALGDRKFDLVLLGDVLGHSRSPFDVMERFLPFVEDGGHVIVSLPDARRTAIELVERAHLELLWVRPALVVARKRPVGRKLSLTVGMISMNEENAVGGVLDDIKKHAPEAEILLVDSSKDRTPEIAEGRGARVVRQVPPRGYGPAMDRLLYEAKTDVILTMDCDGTYPADRILDLHRMIEDGADLVNGTRTHHRPDAMPLANFVANRVFAGAAHVLHGIPTTDVHSGMRAYRTSMLRGIDVDPKGPALPVELLVVPARQGYRIIEVDIAYLERIGNTTLQRFDSTKWTFKRLLRATVGQRVRRDRVRIL